MNIKRTRRHLGRIVVSLLAVTLAATTMARADAHSATTGFSDTDIITSEVTVTQSMVAGSSPTSLGHSVLAGKAEPAGDAVTSLDHSDLVGETEPAEDTGFEGETTSAAIAELYAPSTGTVLARQRFGPATEGRHLSITKLRKRLLATATGTGGTSSSQGCIRVTVTQQRDGALGFFAAKAWIWTDWCWKNSTQVVSVNLTGHGHDQASGYSFDGWEDPHQYYYDWGTNNGYPKSAYHYDQTGGFTSPGCCGVQGHWYPKETLDSYRDGTWLWFTSA